MGRSAARIGRREEARVERTNDHSSPAGCPFPRRPRVASFFRSSRDLAEIWHAGGASAATRGAPRARATRSTFSRGRGGILGFTIEGEGGRAGAHEVHSDGGDVALRVGVVLRRGEGGHGRRRQRGRRGGDASADEDAAARTERRRTAKRSKRHDLPTPESPISCGGGRGRWAGRGREDVGKMFRAARGRGDLRIARRRDVDDAARDAESRHGRGSRTHQELEEVIVFGVHRDGAVVERARVMVWRALGRRRTSSGARDVNG